LGQGLIHTFTNPLKIETDHDWFGCVFECAIGAHLLRITGQLSYWIEGDLEVDFVITRGTDVYGIEGKSGRRAKKSGMLAFQKKFPNAKCLLLNLERGATFLQGEPTLQRLLAL
jgi:predicted AAA+ superfamily ATPase